MWIVPYCADHSPKLTAVAGEARPVRAISVPPRIGAKYRCVEGARGGDRARAWRSQPAEAGQPPSRAIGEQWSCAVRHDNAARTEGLSSRKGGNRPGRWAAV